MMRHFWGIGAVLAAIAVLVPVANADISNNVFDVEICHNGTCVGTFWADMNQGTWNGDVFEWVLRADQIIYNDFSGEVAATLKANDTRITVTPPGSKRSNPGVSLGFSVVAGATATQFTINSALLSFVPMPNAAARATASFTVTDNDPDLDGATLSGLNPQAYETRYNGFFFPAPAGTTFRQMIPQVVADPMGAATLSETYPLAGAFAPIGGPVSSMASQIHFSLTPYDLASGTSLYEIQPIPEPTSLLILVAGLALVRRRS